MQFSPLYARWRALWIPQQFPFNLNLQGTNYTLALTDTFTLTDLITRSITRLLTDTLTLVDTLNRAATRTLLDTITLLDVFARNNTFTRMLSEVISIADIFREIPPVRLLDVITLVDYFLIRKLVEPNLTYFRRYLSDPTSITVPLYNIPPSSLVLVVDPSVTYYRQYLGRI